jgi:leucyl-tRNA synthetase
MFHIDSYKRCSADMLAAFEEQQEASHKAEVEAAKASNSKEKPVVSKKSKVAQKTGGVKRQWDILLASGVSAAEIPKFVDSMYWLSYFPPHCITDLKHAGCAIDFRRSFITTDVNPVESFILCCLCL